MYLLKIKRKKDETQNISIHLANEYIEFENVTEIIKFVYENALFIESYRVFELKNFEENLKDSMIIACGSCGDPGGVRIEA